MSKFCGIWHFDGHPVSERETALVHAALNVAGYGEIREAGAPGVLAGWAAGSESPARAGVFQSVDGSWCVCDGRIDNRADLLEQTGLPGGSLESAIALALYRQKEADGLGDLVGDWSLCIWDATRREMVLASDYAGTRPLYYHRGAGTLCWSSSLEDLVDWTGITALDEGYAASFLIRATAGELTPYREILAIPSGNAVLITAKGIRRRTFWELPYGREIRYRDEGQYEEQCLELFRQSVRARMSVGTAVCAELSGGLDSSSVVCMAARVRSESPASAVPVTSLTYVQDESGDEKFFREVERFCGLPACHLELQHCPAASASVTGPLPGLWEPRFRELAARLGAMGSGALLTGQLGDFIMGNTFDDTGQVAEWLARGRVGKAARESYAWAHAMQVPIYPILGRAMREAWFHWAPSSNPADAVGAIPGSREDSVSATLHSRLKTLDAEQNRAALGRHAPAGKRLRFRALGEILQARWLQTPAALQHLSYSHPFAHRPLVEFLLALPLGILFRANEPRRLMRRAFAGLLPPMVVRRKSKAAYTDTYRSSLVPMAAELLKSPSAIRVIECGYADRTSLIGRLEKFVQGIECNESQLRSLLLFEFWIRQRVRQYHAAPVPRAALTIS